MANFPHISPVWSDIMGCILPMSKSNNVTCIVGRLIVAATSYYIWQEHNKRIHGKKDRKLEEVMNIIVDMIRLKFASIKFKKKAKWML
ncbi:hypothetical protein Tco_1436240 [Tanacetum coccineum]